MDCTPYIGLPFLARGRDRHGLDCWGLVRLVYAEQFGIELPSLHERYTDIDDFKTLAAVTTTTALNWQEVPAGQEQVGDVLVFRIKNFPVHVAVCLGQDQMLHVHEGIETVIDRYDRSPHWANRLVAAYRYKRE